MLRKIINDAKDDYLQNRIAAAQSRLNDYAQIVEQYRADAAAWNAAPQTPMTQFELSQMYDEMRILLQQIANGQDYFGNPNGWVPMLSFEVYKSIFETEINNSLDIIYLTRWLSQKQDDAVAANAALGTARAKLWDEIEIAKTNYDTAATALSGLQAKADELGQRGANLELQLQAEDNKLHDEAVRNTRPSDWETGLRLGLKIDATILKMVPVYQPTLGVAGDALRLASDFDPDTP